MSIILTAFLSALLFGIGLGLSGMTLPDRVIGFLDVTGDWNPSLVFVMIGAIAVHSLSYRLIRRRESPILTSHFQIPSKRHIDRKLILGSLLFGVGWGLGGFCPGPGIVASVAGGRPALLFLFSMIVGIYLHQLADKAKLLTRVSSHGN